MKPSHARYLDHSVTREDRADGSIILRSNLPLGSVAPHTLTWLHRWARETPDRVFIAQRSGDGWEELTFGEMLNATRRIATGLLEQGIGCGDAIVVLSGPSIDHAALTLAAQYVGAILVPLAEQYALIPEARGRLEYCATKTKPKMVYADDGQKFAEAIALPVFDGLMKVVSHRPQRDMKLFADLSGEPGRAVEDALARVDHDTVTKILFTSGSTSDPKGVPQTQRMLCVNQAQYLACLPVLGTMHHRMVDWLPWNHVFAGNSNFNLMLSLGGTWYLDDGKPTGPLAARTLENMRMHQSTLSFDVPVAHVMQVAAMQNDPQLRAAYFQALEIFFYAGASLPDDVWNAVEEMSIAETGNTPMMMSSWGLTETAPSVLNYHEKGARSGMVGVPAPEIDVKLIPLGDDRYEIRVRGPNVFTGYLDDPERSRTAFDGEGYFITGDAMRFVDPDDANRGLRFDGRIGEDFKLITGTWVQASTLRLDTLAALAGKVQDLVIVGEGKGDVGALIFPQPEIAAKATGEVVDDPAYLHDLKSALQALADRTSGSSKRIARAIVMAEPADVGAGEITAKGSLNVGAIVKNRAAILAQLYSQDHPAVLRMKGP